MRIPSRSAVPALLLMVALGCAPAAPAPFTDADAEANRALSQGFAKAMTTKDRAGVAEMYSENAFLLPPNSPAIHGRPAIAAFLQGFPPMTELTLTTDSLVGYGAEAWATGRYHLTLGIDGAPVDSGTFLDVREKQKDGSWVYVADMFHSSIPPATAAH